MTIAGKKLKFLVDDSIETPIENVINDQKLTSEPQESTCIWSVKVWGKVQT